MIPYLIRLKQKETIIDVDFTPILKLYEVKSFDELIKPGKQQPYCECRQVCMYALSKMGYNHDQIAKLFKRTRDSVYNGIERINGFIDTYELPEIIEAVKEIKEKQGKQD